MNTPGAPDLSGAFVYHSGFIAQAANTRAHRKSGNLPFPIQKMYLAGHLFYFMFQRYQKITAVLIAFFITGKCFSQSVSINNTAAIADSTAILDVSSTTKGLLVPRMTAAQKTGIVTPATGLLIYQTDGEAGFYYFNGAGWLLLVSAPVNTNKQNTLIYTIKGF